MNFKDFKLTHSEGLISIETIPEKNIIQGNLGIQIENGKVWLCINGIAFLRFSPKINKPNKGNKNEVI